METPLRTGKAWLLAALIGWVLFLVPVVAAVVVHGMSAIYIQNDDAMRLVEVRDLIAGRGWFDHMQPRLGVGEGTWIHWSRLVDVPIAALILAFTPFLGQAGAENVALIAWPLLVAIIPIATVAFTAHAFTGLRGAILSAVLMAQMLFQTTEFSPGSLDHHNVQMSLLIMALCFAVVSLSRPGFAVGSGIAVAATVAVGIETLPHVAALGVFLALLWALRGPTVRRAVMLFSGGLAASLATFFVMLAPPVAYTGGYCDSLSIDQAAPILIGSLGLLVSAWFLSDRGALARVGALFVIGAIAAAEAKFLTPGCLSNPVDQLDPFLKSAWFDQVSEVQPLFTALSIVPTYLVPQIAIWCIAITSTAALIWMGRNRFEWIVVALMLLAAMGMTLWQIRGAMFIGILSVLPITCMVDRIYGYGEARGQALIRIGALVLFFVSVPQLWVFIVLGNEEVQEQVAEGGNPFTGFLDQCYKPRELAALAALPPGLTAAGSNLGAFILLETPHSTLSAPYHRNQAGMLAELRIDYASDDEAERLLREAGVDYVVMCSENPEFNVQDGSKPGFSFRLKDGDYPDFLVPLRSHLDDPLITVYRLADPA